MLENNPYSNEVSETMSLSSVQSMVTSSVFSKQNYYKKIYYHTCIANTAINIKYPNKNRYRTFKRILSIIQYLKDFELPIEFNVNYIGQYISKLYQLPYDTSIRFDIEELIIRIID